jgi:hypothetical protein
VSIRVLFLGLLWLGPGSFAAPPGRTPVNADRRVDQRLNERPLGWENRLVAARPQESKPAFAAVRRGQVEVRPAVSLGTAGIKKKRLVTLDLD